LPSLGCWCSLADHGLLVAEGACAQAYRLLSYQQGAWGKMMVRLTVGTELPRAHCEVP